VHHRRLAAEEIQPAHPFSGADTPDQFQPSPALDRALAPRRRIRLAGSDLGGAGSAPGPLNPGLSRCLLPLAPRRTPHRFATTNARRETNAHRATNAPRPLRSGGGRRGCVPAAPLFPWRLSRPLLFVRRPATALRTRSKLESRLLRAVGRRGFCYASSSSPLVAAARVALARSLRLEALAPRGPNSPPTQTSTRRLAAIRLLQLRQK
jgi:hypothetical protein